MVHTGLNHRLNGPSLPDFGRFRELNSQWTQQSAIGAVTDSRTAFIAKETGQAEEAVLTQIGAALGWPMVDLSKETVVPEVRNRVSTKVAFQHTILPIAEADGVLKVAVSDPFDTAMIAAVQFEAKSAVDFVLAPRQEID